MKFFVLYSKGDSNSDRVESLIGTAFNNVQQDLDYTCLGLDLNSPEFDPNVLDVISVRAWDFPAVLVISDRVWQIVLSRLGETRCSEVSGYRHIVAPTSSRAPVLVLKVDRSEINLNELSEYIKWMVLEVEYYEHRKSQQDVEWTWNT